MTEQQVLRILQKVYRQQNLLDSLRSELQHIIEDIGPKAIDPQIPKTSGGKDPDLSNTLTRIERRRNHLLNCFLKQVDKMITLKKNAYDLVSLCQDEEAQSILVDRYLRNLKWEDIIASHHYSKARIFDFRQKGIREIAINTRKKCHKKDWTKLDF